MRKVLLPSIRSRLVRAAASALVIAASLSLGGPVGPVAAACNYGSVCATLTVVLSGDGTGNAVTLTNGAPDGRITCSRSHGVTSGTCSHTYYVDFGPVAFDVHLAPATGSYLCYPFCEPEGHTVDWDGTLSGTSGDQSDSFEFKLGNRKLTVDSTQGIVSSNPTGIYCYPGGGTCTKAFDFGSPITLTATSDPATSSIFDEWDGPCAGQGASCTLSLTSDQTITAYFGIPAISTATPAPGSTPRGTAGSTSGPGASPTASASIVRSPAPSRPGGPGSSSPASAAPPATEGEGGSPLPSSPLPAFGNATPAPSANPGLLAAATGGAVDLTPIVLAIIGAGLLIGLGVSLLGLQMRRRGPRS